jgi:hypothetical protein
VNRAYEVERTFIEGDRTTAVEIAALIETGAFWVLEHAGGICAAVLLQGPGQRASIPPSHAYLGMLSVLPEMAKPLAAGPRDAEGEDSAP